MNDGSAVGDVVLVPVRIEEKVGRVEDPHATISVGERGDHVEPFKKRLVKVIFAISVGILMDGDLILPLEFAVFWSCKWRRWRHLVEDFAEVFVPCENFESCGIRILDILHDPEPSSFVEVHEERLPDLWFTENRFYRQTGAGPERGKGLLRGGGLTLVIRAGIRVSVVFKVPRNR